MPPVHYLSSAVNKLCVQYGNWQVVSVQAKIAKLKQQQQQ